MKIKMFKIPEDLKPIIEVAPAELQVGKVKEVGLSSLPSEEQWDFVLRGAELCVLVAGRGAGLVSIAKEKKDKSLSPYDALPTAHEGMKLIKELREKTDEYHSLVPRAWPEEDIEALNRILKKLERSFGALLDSEKKLQRLGWKFEPMTGKVKRIAKHVGKDLDAEVVWGIYRAKFVGEEPTAQIAQKIAKELSDVLPASKLGVGAQDLIRATIRSRLKRAK